MKMLSNFIYSLKQAIKGMFKNKTMSFISIISVTSALIILGIVLSLVFNINDFIKTTKDEINQIRVMINLDGLEDEYSVNMKWQEIKDTIESMENVKTVDYETKERSFDDLKEQWEDDAYLLEGMENPLEDAFIITINSTDKMESTVKTLQEIDGVTEVEYYQEIMENFLNMSNTIKKFGSILIGGLLLICLVIISNTIKGRVHGKKEEIQIIKYVGGSNLFVIAPFIIEGFFIGLIGSILSISISLGMYGYVAENVTNMMSTIMGNTMLSIGTISPTISLVLLTTGILVGVLGSALSVKRYLKV